jgi:hypothetical protein
MSQRRTPRTPGFGPAAGTALVPTLALALVLVAAVGLVAADPAPAPAPQAAPAAAGAAPAAAAGGAAAKPSGPVPPEAMQGLKFDGLTDAQKQLAISILNDNGCDCGCGMKLAVCRRDDPKCGRSLALSNQVLDLVKQGKTREEIVKTALTPPTKFVQFDLQAGDAPAIGPATAKVTILHYLDYQ